MYRIGTLAERRTPAHHARIVRKHRRRDDWRMPIAARLEQRASIWATARAWFSELRLTKYVHVAPRCQFTVTPSKQNPVPGPCGGKLRRVMMAMETDTGLIIIRGFECKACGRRSQRQSTQP